MKINTPKYYWNNVLFKLKRHFLKVLETKHSDRAIAWGFALGSFVAILPTPGISALLALLMIAVFKNINKASVLLALAIWNVFTVIPIYWLSLKIGNLIFQSESKIRFEFELFNQAFEFTRRFLIGNMIISIPIAIGCFYLAQYGIKKLRKEYDDTND